VAKDIVKGDDIVREHPAPLGALRHDGGLPGQVARSGQGAPRTARCIKTIPIAAHMASRCRSGSTPHR